MSKTPKDHNEILKKLGIEKLNPMQEAAGEAILKNDSVILLSPTGTGKTLAFLLPVLQELDKGSENIQALILVPSRELAIQIEQVAREMGSGFKVNAVYGGRAFSKDKIELAHPPAILIGTPGRIADHLRREFFPTLEIKILVLDEFDKSLEVGFEAEMREIIDFLPNVQKRILTSATNAVSIPHFAGVVNPAIINFLQAEKPQLHIKTVLSPSGKKLDSLVELLNKRESETGIIFCNYKESISEVSDFLAKRGISHGSFHGGLEQKERERSLIKFRNGTHRILLATDLAARGIDVPELNFIIHYQLPPREEEFIHRNGRTARMKRSGVAYVLRDSNEKLPEFIDVEAPGENEAPKQKNPVQRQDWSTLFISGGRKDKISKGDIAGLFLKQGNLQKEQLGAIELKQDCAFVSVSTNKAEEIVAQLNNSRLKKKKVRIYKI